MSEQWAFYFAEMWERLWDFVIYPILKVFGYEVEDGKLVDKNPTEAE